MPTLRQNDGGGTKQSMLQKVHSDQARCKTERQGEGVVQGILSVCWAKWHTPALLCTTTICSNKQRAVMACLSPRYRNLPQDLRLKRRVILLESLHTAAPILLKPHKHEISPFSPSLPPSLYPLSSEPAWWTSIRHSSIVKHTKMLLTLQNKMANQSLNSLTLPVHFQPICDFLSLSLCAEWGGFAFQMAF